MEQFRSRGGTVLLTNCVIALNSAAGGNGGASGARHASIVARYSAQGRMRGSTPSTSPPLVTTRLGTTTTRKRACSAASAARATSAARSRPANAASNWGNTTATSAASVRSAGSPVKNSRARSGAPADGARKTSIVVASTT